MEGIKNNVLGLTSQAFNNFEAIPEKYTGDGENMSPPLTIIGTDNAASYAILVDDLDADNFVHWLVWNIPNHQESIRIEEGVLPVGAVQGTNSFGKIGYSGPCPPHGEHRYRFMVCAMNKFLDAQEGSTLEEVMKMATNCKKSESILIGKYKRKV